MDDTNLQTDLQSPDSSDEGFSSFDSLSHTFTPLPARSPTPPMYGVQSVDEQVSISSTFSMWHTLPPDLVFSTSDSVLFYVHSHLVLAMSENRFHSLIPIPSIDQPYNSVIHVPEGSQTFNIILHLVYNIPSKHYSPSMETLSSSVDRLSFYGVQAKKHIVAKTPLYSLLLSYAPLFPIEVYTLAAKHDLLDLAIAVSSHLLSFNVFSLTTEIGEQMGAIYLRKLFFLLIGRNEALKRLLSQPLLPHVPTDNCSFHDQRSLSRAWSLASAYIAWDARPDMSTGFLESSLNPLVSKLTCNLCKESLENRIRNVITAWSQVKRTI
ncbi:hypothetical protein GYMLUDRAFT_197821 [Collybiopsis luxurians FD-317 M1]|uniref:BTB domain-containing protein n=1 Tax=Collybiopsis luxurians FD-317 M1 TaxID=944289 RepID=A0A0D0BFN2_9AGAR|nr:hypothetical protein GYMLUDRAFT_197821 [Collybiopsis luxurians FD-317 M1]